MSTDQEGGSQAKRPRIQAPQKSPEPTAVPALPKIDTAKTNKLLDKVMENQTELDGVNEQASLEILAVEEKFNKIRRPLYDQRAQIISEMPYFWITALLNHSVFSDLIDEDEEDCLQSLKNLNVIENDDIKSGYKIVFTFHPNNYFEETEITKTISMMEGSSKIETSSVTWKDAAAAAIAKNKKRTFFPWLVANDADAVEICDVIREDIWANPVYYFTASDGTTGEHESEAEDSEEDSTGEGNEDDEEVQ